MSSDTLCSVQLLLFDLLWLFQHYAVELDLLDSVVNNKIFVFLLLDENDMMRSKTYNNFPKQKIFVELF